MMQFLNIYPKRILATLSDDGAFEGQFTFDLEQYGLITSDVVCDISVTQDQVMAGGWKIWVKPLFDIEMPHFDKFVEALNHSVFEVLQYTPSRSAAARDLPAVKLFFTDVYFDMSGTQPVVKKIVRGA
jgi:hypothetical protein